MSESTRSQRDLVDSELISFQKKSKISRGKRKKSSPWGVFLPNIFEIGVFFSRTPKFGVFFYRTWDSSQFQKSHVRWKKPPKNDIFDISKISRVGKKKPKLVIRNHQFSRQICYFCDTLQIFGGFFYRTRDFWENHQKSHVRKKNTPKVGDKKNA